MGIPCLRADKVKAGLSKEVDPRVFGVHFETSGSEPTIDSTAGWKELEAWVEENTVIADHRSINCKICMPTGASLLNAEALNFPSGTFIEGQGKGTTLQQAADDQAFFNLEGRYLRLQNFSVQCEDGTNARCIDVDRFARSTMSNIWLNQLNINQPAMRLNPDAPSGFFVGSIDNIIVCHGDRENTQPVVPSILIESDSPKVQGFSFRDIAIYRWGDVIEPAWTIKNFGGGRADGNVFQNVVFEHCRGGGLHMAQISGSTFSAITSYDSGDAATLTGGILKFESSRAKGSTANTIISSGRASGQLAAGVADIFFDADCDANTIISLVDMEVTAANGRSPFTVDFSGSKASVISSVTNDGTPDLAFLNDANVSYVSP